MSLYTQLKELGVLPEEKKIIHPYCQWGTCIECMGIECHNQGINAVFDVLKKVEVGEEEVFNCIVEASKAPTWSQKYGIRMHIAKALTKANLLKKVDE